MNTTTIDIYENTENVYEKSSDEIGCTVKEMKESERPREKLLIHGPGKLTNAELVAVLLRSGVKNNNAISTGQLLLNQSNQGVRGLADMDLKDFCQIKGVGKAKAAIIMAALELGRRVAAYRPDRFRITNPSDVHRYYMEEMRYYKKEVFKVVLLNTKNEILCDKDVSIGSLNYSVVHPREVFLEPVRRSANSIILMHNHPSGNPVPSNEDIRVTKRLKDCGNLMGIEVLDHIIIGDGAYFSMLEENLF